MNESFIEMVSPLTTRGAARSEDGTSAEDVKLALLEADVPFAVDALDPFIVLYTEGIVTLDEVGGSCKAKLTFASGRWFRSSSTSMHSSC